MVERVRLIRSNAICRTRFKKAVVSNIREGFSRPVTVSLKTVTALDAISFAAAMFILAASVNASGADVISLSFLLSPLLPPFLRLAGVTLTK
jgi:hypothetical protein